MKFKKVTLTFLLVIIGVVFLLLSSCRQTEVDSAPAYDPNKPVVLESFFPDSGIVAEPVILRGENFGNNVNDVKVYFNDHEAFVATVKGNRMFVVTPKCTYEDTVYISVEIGGKRQVFDKYYAYTTTSVVSTVAGGSTDAAESFNESTIAMAQFNKSIQAICVNKDDELFFASDLYIYMLNEKENFVKKIYDCEGGLLSNVNAITTDSSQKRIFSSLAWHPKHVLVFNPETEYEVLSRDVTDALSQIKITGSHHSGLAVSPVDGKIYSHAQGDNFLYRYNPDNFRAEVIEDRSRMPQTGETHGLAFHPLHPELLYISFQNHHCIYSYNTETREFKLITGKVGQSGNWVGDAKNSLFNTPKCIAFDKNGDLYIVDSRNHCIKKLSADGQVSLVAGSRDGISGYEDGEASSAIFNSPFGIAINSEGIIYITEEGNRSVRRLAIE